MIIYVRRIIYVLLIYLLVQTSLSLSADLACLRLTLCNVYSLGRCHVNRIYSIA